MPGDIAPHINPTQARQTGVIVSAAIRLTQGSMRSIRHTLLLLVLVCSGFLSAGEVKYIDLTSIQQRTELRTLPSPPMNCGETSNCLGGGWSGGSVADGAPDMRDPHALGVFLLRVTPTDFDPEEPFEAE